MFANNAVRHEETEARPIFLSCEVGFEEAVTVVVRDAGTVVRDADVWVAAAPAGGRRDVPSWRGGIDGVVHQVRDHLADEKRIRAHLDIFSRFAHGELNFLDAGPWTGHPDRAGNELVEVDGIE